MIRELSDDIHAETNNTPSLYAAGGIIWVNIWAYNQAK